MKKDLIGSTDIENIIEERFSNLEIEEKVIAYIVRKDWKIISKVEENYFVNNSYQFFYEVIKKYNGCYIKKLFIDLVEKESSKKELRKKLLYTDKIFKTKIKEIKKSNIETLITEIKTKYQKRMAMGSIQKVINSIDDDFDLAKVKKILSPIYNLNREEENKEKDIIDDYEEIKEKIKDRKNNKENLIPTGIPKIDKAIGGIMKGEWGLIAAETGRGKSVMLSNLSVNAWNDGKNVVFFSLEMPYDQVMLRIYANISRILYHRFRVSSLTKKDYDRWEKSIEEYRKSKKNFLKVIEKPRGANCLEIEEDCYNIQEKTGKKIDLIIIDYLNIMSANKFLKGVAGKEQTVQSEISWNIKQLSSGFNNEGVALWTAGQILDSYFGKLITTEGIKYSKGIMENCPLAMGLSETEDDEFLDTLTINFIKQRDSKKIKPFQILPEFEYMKFSEIIKTDSGDFANRVTGEIINKKRGQNEKKY